ncbi:hypothetical protein [Nostoc sp.]|uniref:hypothetical protein n=1 Tax=Nostoc sp. TaxID=1180 RepID=UPI002FF5FDA5
MSVWDWQLGCYFGIHGTEATKLTISAFYVANEFYNVLKRKDLWYKLEVFFGSILHLLAIAFPSHRKA